MKYSYFIVWSILLFVVSLSGSRLFAQDEKIYNPGYYYTADSSKVSGLISYSYMDYGTFYFKDSLYAKKRKIKAEDCIGFHIVDADFQSLDNVKLKIGVWNTQAAKCFGELRMAGEVSLYIVYSQVAKPRGFGITVSNGAQPGMGNNMIPSEVINYVLMRKGSDEIKLVPKKSKPFKKEMTAYFSDKPDVVNFMNTLDCTAEDIETIVKMYNKSK